ncbi:MAG: Flp family type IVb pilin [Sphingomicrobium sp.]
MLKRFRNLFRDARGATAIEYALLASLIAVAAIVAMKSLGSNLNTTYSKVSNELG